MITRTYAKWVPQAAQETLNELFAMPGLTPRDCAILSRIARHQVMKTDVWQRLPRNPPNRQGLVICSALEAAHYAEAATRPPMPKKKSEIAAWIRAHPPLRTADNVSAHALMLKEAMNETAPDAADYWTDLWPGDAEISIDRAIAVVGHLEDFYRRLSAQHRALIKAANLPKLPRKKGVPQVYFSEVMSKRMVTLYGQPHDAIVGTLTEVVFNLRPGVINEEIVRGRRRKNPPEHSREKSA